MTRTVRVAAVLLAALTLAITAGAGTALGHTTRVSADPPEDAALTVGPATVRATFNEPLQTFFAVMTVVGPDDNLWSSGQAQVQGAMLSVPVRPLGPVGTYHVNYRVTSADGHPVSGSWSFRLTVAGAGRPGPAVPRSGASGGIPVWPFALGALILAGSVAAAALRRRT